MERELNGEGTTWRKGLHRERGLNREGTTQRERTE